MEIDKQLLISEIRKAFKDVVLGDGIGLSEATAIDEYKDSVSRSECRSQDEKLEWENIPSEALNQNYTSLSFFDAKGMQFHLPAFMIAEINEEYRFGMSFPLAHLSDYSKSQFALLSTEQREAVKLFLEYLSENQNYEFEKDSIKRAVETYWSN